jgi:predicted YcjX-like family ATPase
LPNVCMKPIAIIFWRAGEDEMALSTLPPGRFLMPGDMAGSPALTFAPLPIDLKPDKASQDHLYTTMAHRFEAYKTHVVKPFFLNHFARLDRQIILVDLLHALNVGPQAITDLRLALADILKCFQVGRKGLLSALWRTRIDKILFAATKADHVLSQDHQKLGQLLQVLVEDAIRSVHLSGAHYEVMSIAAVRATREATLKVEGEALPAVSGTPLEGEMFEGKIFDGQEEIAVFPGDLPQDPKTAFLKPSDAGIRFLRFRPPHLPQAPQTSLPHIRLDKALHYLLDDYLI